MYIVGLVHLCNFVLASRIVWVVMPWCPGLLKRPPSWMWSNLSLIITSTWWRFKTYFTINMPLGDDGSGISLHQSIFKYWNLYPLYIYFAKEIPTWWYQKHQVVCLPDLFTIWHQKMRKYWIIRTSHVRQALTSVWRALIQMFISGLPQEFKTQRKLGSHGIYLFVLHKTSIITQNCTYKTKFTIWF